MQTFNLMASNQYYGNVIPFLYMLQLFIDPFNLYTIHNISASSYAQL